MRWINRHKLRILMYHRFFERDALARQCACLRRHYQLVTMAAVSEWLHSGRPLPPHAVAVTVDDGYADFQHTGWPVFARYGIPVTVFLITDFMDRRMWLWFDRIRHAFEHAGISTAAIGTPDGSVLHCRLDSGAGRRAAAQQIIARAEAMSRAHQREFVERLPALLEAPAPEQAPPEYQPLTWDEVRALAAAGVEFGAHTKTHPILSAVRDPAELREEIAGCKARIECELQRPVLHFCYPNGKMPDIGAAAVECVRAAGLRTAVTAEPGLNGPQPHAWLLHRTGIDPGYEASYFRQLLAGVGG
jgi:peptidoglycan/xylan/chitin deacetylase (PgdA/CDA1 family)